MICGLLGGCLGHSYSPMIHEYLGDYEYDLFQVEHGRLHDFLENTDFHGLNVTMPYKKAVIPYLSWISPEAERIGSVNTIVREDDGLYGYNTDYFGFLYAAEIAGISFWGKKVLVLGSGGASLAVQAAVKDSAAREVLVVSRTGELNYSNISQHSDADIIVNATPVGMCPDNDGLPVDLGDFPKCSGVIDLVYNPMRTRLVLEAEKREIKCTGGLAMLVAQAKYASDLFLNIHREDDMIGDILDDVHRELADIVLVGMPGCGKSSVGAHLAQRLSRTFVDTDAEVEKLAGCIVPDIIARDGEACFRKLESQVISELSRKNSLVIATGGGAVLENCNVDALRQNGMVFFIRRELDKLAVQGRPLSMAGSLADMYDRRRSLYEKAADFTVDNDKTVAHTSDDILELGGWI
ncbi:MAG: shikimate kinase [Spirochaetia bacterium]|nr:shikimate kinase [Spirochaetia bacterium]